VPLSHGDIAVREGPARLRYDGVTPLKTACHHIPGEKRLNPTFCKAL